MSVDYFLVCHVCAKRIHIAQDGLGGWSFYSDEPDCMEKLSDWFAEHALAFPGHGFILHNEDIQSSQDYAPIEWNPK